FQQYGCAIQHGRRVFGRSGIDRRIADKASGDGFTMLFGGKAKVLPKIFRLERSVWSGRLRRRSGGFGWKPLRLWVGGGKHQHNAHHNSVTALMVFVHSLFFGVPAGGAAGEIDDLGEGRENLN